jgi:hypothetical protein
MSMSRSSSLISGEKDDVCCRETAEDDPASGAVDFRASTVLSATEASSPPIVPKFNLLIN